MKKLTSNLIEARKMWDELTDVAVDKDDCIMEDWHHFKKGTYKIDIWRWFEEYYGVSVADDLMDNTKKIIKIVERSDRKEVYGYLKTDISVRKVQDKINEIVSDKDFVDEYPDWMVEDVLKKFPEDWEWEFIMNTGDMVEI